MKLHSSRLNPIVFAAFTLTAGNALGAPVVWSGGGANALWTNTANWTGGSA